MAFCPDYSNYMMQVGFQNPGLLSVVSMSVVLLFCSIGLCCLGFKKKNPPNQQAFIPLNILREATTNFSEANILGSGGSSVVYKGVLGDGTCIAVKRLSDVVLPHEFEAEVAILNRFHHRHLVALIGYCIEGKERMLVYEFMPQGTLSQHLFHSGFPPLEWKQRLSIALDVARGMEYLHHGLADESFIHRDLKPSNILLGTDFRAKVSDFGLLKPIPREKHSVETTVEGTFGYLDPQYAVSGRVTTKADVFSFGVVLVELITGRRAQDGKDAHRVAERVVRCFQRPKGSIQKRLSKLVDATILSENKLDLQSIRVMAKLAGHCTEQEPDLRPDMSYLVNRLSSLVENWKPTNGSRGGSQLSVFRSLVEIFYQRY